MAVQGLREDPEQAQKSPKGHTKDTVSFSEIRLWQRVNEHVHWSDSITVCESAFLGRINHNVNIYYLNRRLARILHGLLRAFCVQRRKKCWS
jgi:hypothetical protein